MPLSTHTKIVKLQNIVQPRSKREKNWAEQIYLTTEKDKFNIKVENSKKKNTLY